MGLKEKIMDDVKDAMKNKESDRLGTLRFLHSAIKNREIELRPNAITDEEILGVIKKLAKQRRDSIDQFQNAGRTDLVDKEKSELTIIESYLPAQLTPAKVEEIVLQAIAALNATSIKDMGKVMKEVLARSAGAADSKMVSEIVKSKLQ